MKIDLNSLSYNVESLHYFLDCSIGRKVKKVYTVNSEFILKAEQDSEFYQILKQGECSVDGQILKWILDRKTKKDHTKVSGSEVLPFLEKEQLLEKRVFLLGGIPNASVEARKRLEAAGYNVESNTDIVKDLYQPSLVKQIVQFRPNFLFVALGSGKQEKFIHYNANELDGNVGIAIGCGGAIDMFGGIYERAPEFIQVVGLESIFRYCQEPSLARLKRITFSLPIFKYVI